jgi:hypothetical protein
MKAGWKLFLLFALIFAASFAAERLFLPHVVPIGFSEEPQPLWSVETAFVLRAIELMSGGVAVLSLVVSLGAWTRRLQHRRASSRRQKALPSQIAR